MSFRLSAPITEQNRPIEFEQKQQSSFSNLTPTVHRELSIPEPWVDWDTLLQPQTAFPSINKTSVSTTLASLFLSCHLLFLGGTVHLELLFLSGGILFLLLFTDYMKTWPYNGHQNEGNDFYPFPQYVNELFVKHSSTYRVPHSSHCDHCCCIFCRFFTHVSVEAHCFCVLRPCLSLIILWRIGGTVCIVHFIFMSEPYSLYTLTLTYW